MNRYFGTAMAPLWKQTYHDVPNLIMATGYDKIKAVSLYSST